MGFPEVGIGPAARQWFEANFAAPTPVQREGWARIAAGEHALLVAPTGSGKTLAAFFYCIDRLSRLPETAEAGVRVVYVSPLKALVYDIERNLRAPLAGLAHQRQEPSIVRIVVEHAGSAIAAVDHVIAESSGREPGRPRHAMSSPGPSVSDPPS